MPYWHFPSLHLPGYRWVEVCLNLFKLLQWTGSPTHGCPGKANGTPGDYPPWYTSGSELGWSQNGVQMSGRTLVSPRLFHGHPFGRRRHHRANFMNPFRELHFLLYNSWNHFHQSLLLLDLDVRRFQAVFFAFAVGSKMSFNNFHFLLKRIPWDFNDLHPVRAMPVEWCSMGWLCSKQHMKGRILPDNYRGSDVLCSGSGASKRWRWVHGVLLLPVTSCPLAFSAWMIDPASLPYGMVPRISLHHPQSIQAHADVFAFQKPGTCVPSEVLPAGGLPNTDWRIHIAFNFKTAKCSRIRSFTLVRTIVDRDPAPVSPFQVEVIMVKSSQGRSARFPIGKPSGIFITCGFTRRSLFTSRANISSTCWGHFWTAFYRTIRSFDLSFLPAGFA